MPKLTKICRILISIIIIINIVKSYALQTLDPKYGRGQHQEFIDAVYGSNKDIPDAELRELERMVPPKTTDKWFILVEINNSVHVLNKIKNKSTNTSFKSVKLNKTSEQYSGALSGALGSGYRMDRLWFTGELLVSENLKFNQKKLFVNKSESLVSTVRSAGLFGNVYYDLLNFNFIRFFAGAGVGAGINQVKTIVDNTEPHSKRTITGGYNVCLGTRINIVPQLFINIAARYTNFTGNKKLNWLDHSNNLKLTGNHTMYGISVSVIHVFI